MNRLIFVLFIFPVILSAAPIWQGLGTGLNGAGRAIIKDSQGRLYTGGDFTLAGGIPANSIAWWDGIKWNACGSGLNGICRCLAIDGIGNIYAGGDFTIAGGQSCLRIAKWNGSTWTTLGAGFNNSVRSISISTDGTIYAGGTFTKSGTTTVNRIAKWIGNSWQPLGSGLSGSCYALSFKTGAILFVGGSFTTAGGISVNNIASWDGLTWHSLGTGLSNTCRTMAINHDGILLAGGDFVNAGGSLVNRIASWNGISWSGFGSGTNIGLSGGSLSCQSVFADENGNVFAAGGFLVAGGVSASHLAQWKGGAWLALGNGVDNVVNTLFADSCERLFAGSSSATVDYIQGFNLGECLWGSISVGTGGDFSNLTSDYGLFREINTKGINGPVSIRIISDLFESGQYPLQAVQTCGAGPFIISVLAEGNVLRQVSGNCPAGILRFEGARHVNIDGSNEYHLRIKSNSTYAPAILMTDVHDINIIHCMLESRDTSGKGGVVVVMSTTHDHRSENVKIDSNRFKNFPRNGIFVGKGNGSAIQINANDFYNDLNESPLKPMTIIDFEPGSSSYDNVISNNRIGGSFEGLIGEAWKCAGEIDFIGISINAGSCLLEGNQISNIEMTNQGRTDFIGIECFAGLAVIGSKAHGNKIGSANLSRKISMAGYSNFFGIRSMSTIAGIVIEGNVVENIESSCSLGYPNLYGIFFRSGKIRGNIIREIGAVYPATSPAIFGIINLGGTDDTNIISNNMIVLHGGFAHNPRIFGIQDNVISSTLSEYFHNTVLITGEATSQGGTYAFHRNFNGSIFLRNNIFVNIREGGPTLHYSIYTGNSIDYIDSDYNDFYSGQNYLGFCSCTFCQNLSNWQIYSGGDVHSISVLPHFLSASDLHLQPVINPLLIHGGIALPEISKDIDGENRDANHPALGADEE